MEEQFEPGKGPNPNIPTAYQTFFDEVAKGTVRTFRDYHEQFGPHDLVDLANRMPDFYEVELIIDGVLRENGDLPTDEYLTALKGALLEIWPPAAPDIVTKLRKAFGQERKDIEKTGTWSDYQVAMELMPQDIQNEFESLSAEDQDKIYGAFESVNFDLDTEYPTARKAFNRAFGPARGKFNKALSAAWPGRGKPKRVKLPKKRTDEATDLMERHFAYQAVSDLLDGDFINLDPVIGDEACEARPSVLINIWESVQSAYQSDPQRVNSCKQGYWLRHMSDASPTKLRHVSQIKEESEWSNAFIDWCHSTLGDDDLDYLKWCKANTLASTMACDEWGIASYDRNKGVYSSEERAAKRANLARVSVGRIANLAQKLSDNAEEQNSNGKFLQQISSTLDAVVVGKQEEESDVSVLPIYETMRTVLLHERAMGRPIILSLYRIKYDQNEADPYALMAINTLVYDLVEERFTPAENSTIDANRPCVCIQGFQLLNVDDPINVNDGADFFAEGENGYINDFVGCSFPLQVMIYSAVHPPLPHGSVLNGELTGEDCGRAAMQAIQKGNVEQEWGQDIELSRISDFKLDEPPCDLATEYTKLLELGRSCGLDNKQYMTRPGGGQVCVRTDESCAFTIHHINMQSLAQVQQRDGDALNEGDLKRYHNFDKGRSFASQNEAEQ